MKAALASGASEARMTARRTLRRRGRALSSAGIYGAAAVGSDMRAAFRVVGPSLRVAW